MFLFIRVVDCCELLFDKQAWLQHHMEEDMGLCHGGASVGAWWGGELKDLGKQARHTSPSSAIL